MKKPKHKPQPSSKTGPKEPPSQLQLPGGVTVKGYDFRITSVDAQGRPLTFEVVRGNADSDCTLWASPSFMDVKLPANLSERLRKRSEAFTQQEHNDSEMESRFKTDGRTYTKERSVGISTLHVEPRVYDSLKQRLASQGLSDHVVTCGYEPCDGGPCVRPEAHAARERDGVEDEP